MTTVQTRPDEGGGPTEDAARELQAQLRICHEVIDRTSAAVAELRELAAEIRELRVARMHAERRDRRCRRWSS